MPAPGAAAAAARAAAARSQSRSNLVVGGSLVGFVGGVFFYCTRAVQQDEITDDEVAAFKRARERKQQQGS